MKLYNPPLNNGQILFDPPSGWRYGFPKYLPDNVRTNEELTEWLKECGYPEKDIPLALKYSRYIGSYDSLQVLNQSLQGLNGTK